MKKPLYSLILALCLLLTTLSPGCSTILMMTVSPNRNGELETFPYSGTAINIVFIGTFLFSDDMDMPVIALLCFLDFPLSLVLDTAILPYSIAFWLHDIYYD